MGIVMEPICVGMPFLIRVKAVNAAGYRTSKVSSPVILELPPPTPSILNRKAFDGQCGLSYSLPNYNVAADLFPEALVRYELSQNNKELPLSKRPKQKVNGLHNGWPYTFRVRAVNQFGTSEWSKSVKLTPLRKPVRPNNVCAVAGDSKITVLWN